MTFRIVLTIWIAMSFAGSAIKARKATSDFDFCVSAFCMWFSGMMIVGVWSYL